MIRKIIVTLLVFNILSQIRAIRFSNDQIKRFAVQRLFMNKQHFVEYYKLKSAIIKQKAKLEKLIETKFGELYKDKAWMYRFG